MLIRPQRHLLTEDPPSPEKASMSDCRGKRIYQTISYICPIEVTETPGLDSPGS